MSKKWKSLHQINFALRDIQATLKIWQGKKEWDDPYIVKLYKEFDELIVLKQKMQNKEV